MTPTGQISVYYINLASRPDRRVFMERQFATLGIVAQRIEAVLAETVDEARMLPHRDPDNPWALSRVEVACGMSHERTWQALLDSGESCALVLEDDVVLGEAVRAMVVPGIAEEIGADLIKLETMLEAIRLGRPAKLINGRFAARQLLSSHMGGAAYIISAGMARRALADPELRRMSVDRYLFSRGGPIVPSRGLFQIDPAPAVQLEFYDGNKHGTAMRSDLAPDRNRHRASVPHTLAYRLTDSLARARYALRSLAYTLADPVARRERRRVIPFDPAP